MSGVSSRVVNLSAQFPLLQHRLTQILVWISNCIPYKELDNIAYQLPNFNDSTIEVWELIRYFILHITGHVITYPFAFTLLLVHVVLPHPLTHKNIRLTHWGRDKKDAISQTTFWRALSSMKIVASWLDFHWNLFVKVQLTMIRYWFR